MHRTFSVLFAALLSLVSLPSTAQIVRSGSSLTCVLGDNCTDEVIDGQHFFVLRTPQMIVKVAVNPDNRYNHIAVALENRAAYDVRINPSEFRIEMTQPKFKRLSYIEPAKLKLPKSKTQKIIRIAGPPMASSFMGTSSAQASGVTFLEAATLAPSDSAIGEVFFERAAGSNMSLLLPIGGTLFEFPYIPASK